MTCVWTPDPVILGDAWADYEVAVQDRALLLATSSLLTLTYNRVGTCPIKVRPNTVKTCGCSQWSAPAFDCQSCVPGEINLKGPVGYIAEFLIDGEPVDLDDGNWRLDDGHIIVWQGDGDPPFPATQDPSLPDTEVGTYSVTYSQSWPVNQEGRIAVAELAKEYAKIIASPKSKCSLPRGVTNVVRNGVTFTVDAGLFVNGLTGMELVDPFILKWAPAGSPSREAQVFDPRKARRRG